MTASCNHDWDKESPDELEEFNAQCVYVLACARVGKYDDLIKSSQSISEVVMIYIYPLPQTSSPERSGADDFLDALLGGSDSSSAPASPLWSPCTTDSGIYEDPPMDPTESPHPPSCKPFPAFDTHSLPEPPPLEKPPDKLANEMTSDISIDLGESRFKMESCNVV